MAEFIFSTRLESISRHSSPSRSPNVVSTLDKLHIDKIEFSASCRNWLHVAITTRTLYANNFPTPIIIIRSCRRELTLPKIQI